MSISLLICKIIYYKIYKIHVIADFSVMLLKLYSSRRYVFYIVLVYIDYKLMHLYVELFTVLVINE